MSVFSDRLKSTMDKKGITQAKLSSLTGIPKSAISQYLSDKFKPRQERICTISSTLNVSAAWLCGLDDTKRIPDAKKTSLSDSEYAIIHAYRTSPEFKARVDEALGIRAAVGARDSIDGDISDRVSIVTTDYVKNTIGVFTVSLQVSNSMGDTIYLDVTVHVEGNETMAPQIQLKKSLIYVKKGEEPNFEDYLGDVTVNGVLMKKDEIQLLISTNFDSEETGTYNVHYYISTNEGYEGHSILTVVVEE